MKKLLITSICLILFKIATAQLHTCLDLGFMRSINRIDDSKDYDKSMRQANANSLMGGIRVNYDFTPYFNAGLHLLIQKQNVSISTTKAYLENYNASNQWFIYQPSSREILFDHYFMLGPEFNGQIPLGRLLVLQIGGSFLFYDNRQMTPVFQRDLKQQIAHTNYQNAYPSQAFLYRRDAVFLNGWNMKFLGSIRLIASPFNNKNHKISIGFTAGRSVKENYAVHFRTNQINSQTETNALRASNYGGFYGLNLGYSYHFQFKTP